MKLIIFIFLSLIFYTCSSSSNQKMNQVNLDYIKFADTLTSSGIYFTYKDVNEICCLQVGNSKVNVTIPYYGKLDKLDKIPGCAIYTPYWISKNVLIAFSGCGNFFTNNDLFLFHEDSVERQRYGHIEGFDSQQIIAYLEDNSDDFLIVKDVFSNKKDSLFFDHFVSEETLQENMKEYTSVLEGLESKYSGETLNFKDDTISFNFLGKDTFYILNLR